MAVFFEMAAVSPRVMRRTQGVIRSANKALGIVADRRLSETDADRDLQLL